MNGYRFELAGEALVACGSGALWWPARRLLAVSDLHLGKSERIARRGGTLLPPYEQHDTLLRLQTEVEASDAATVICLGDSFDDGAAAQSQSGADQLWLTRLMAGRQWVWIAGNHDPAPLALSGAHLASLTEGPLTFRHIAEPGAVGEVSGHYHPKARVAGRGQAVTRPCFLADAARIILPAFGTYTGGLRSDHPALCGLMAPGALAILTGAQPVALPMPRG